MSNFESVKRILWMNKLVEIQLTENVDETSQEFQNILRDIILYCSPELSMILENERIKRFRLGRCPSEQVH